MALTFDEALIKRVGQFGRGQWLILCASSLCLIANATAFFFWWVANLSTSLAGSGVYVTLPQYVRHTNGLTLNMLSYLTILPFCEQDLCCWQPRGNAPVGVQRPF